MKETYKTTELEGDSAAAKKSLFALPKKEEDPKPTAEEGEGVAVDAED